KVGPLVAEIRYGLIHRNGLAFAHFSAFVGEKSLVANVKSLGSKEAVAAIASVVFLERTQVATFEGQNRIVVVRKRRRLRIRRLGSVFPPESSASARHSHG